MQRKRRRTEGIDSTASHCSAVLNEAACTTGPGRKQLTTVSSPEAVVEHIRRARRIAVLAGAGISVGAGVPDFRSPQGLYRLIEDLGIPVGEPEDLFDIETFKDTPELFYSFAHKVWPSDSTHPTLTHMLLKELADRKKLHRVYTQNIDGLEAKAGIPAAKVVECHGTTRTSRCMSCKKVVKSITLAEAVANRTVPHCPKCRKGILKPEITFFGQEVSPKVIQKMEKDSGVIDLILVIGTSLAVAPVTTLLRLVPHSVPQVLINRTLIQPPKSYESAGFDMNFIGDADDILQWLATSAGMYVAKGRPICPNGLKLLVRKDTPRVVDVTREQEHT